MDIPDAMLDIDQLGGEDEVNDGESQGTGMVTSLKRQIYSRNLEDALSINDDSNLSLGDDDDEDDEEKNEEDRDIDIDRDDNYEDDYDDDEDNDADDNDDDNSNQLSSKSGRFSEKNKPSSQNLKSKSDNTMQSSFKMLGSNTIRRSCLKANHSKATDGDESARPKRRIKVRFNELELESMDSQDSHMSSNEDGTSVGQSSDCIEANQRFKRNGSEMFDCVDEGPNKKAKIDDEMKRYSGNIAHKIKTQSGSMLFTSDQNYIDTYADKLNEGKTCSNLSPDFNYVDDDEEGGGKATMAIVPKRKLEMKKTKLHASRITLLLHRSIDQESNQLRKRLYKSSEQMVLNPIRISIYKNPKPHLDTDFAIQPLSGHEEGEAVSSCVTGETNNTNKEELTQEENEKINRFMKTRPAMYEKSELERPLSSDDISKFVNLMVETFNWNESEVRFAKEVLELVINGKELGLTEEQIQIIYRQYTDLRPLHDLLQIFLNFKIVFKVGILSTRFVASGLVSDWCFTTSLGAIGKEGGTELVQDEVEIPDQENPTEEKESGLESMKKELLYRQTICRPWLKLNGDFNPELLQKLQNSVLSLVMMCPGISESTIHGHFRTIMPLVALKSILEFLELNNCITKHLSVKRNRPNLFDSGEKAVDFDVADNDPYYVPNIDCVLNTSDVL